MPKTIKKKTEVNEFVVEKLNRAYQAVLDGMRTSLLAGKAYGEALLDAEKQIGCNDTELFAWVRKNTSCKLGATTLANYMRLAKNWAKLEQRLGAESLQNKTLVEALFLCRKHKRKPSSRTPAPVTPSGVIPSMSPRTENADGSPKNLVTTAQSANSKEPEGETPIAVPPPFDLPSKDRRAAVYAQNGPAPTVIQLMTNVVTTLKRVTQSGVESDQVPFLTNAIQEALVLLDVLKQKYSACLSVR
jgi:hypothetical protein